MAAAEETGKFRRTFPLPALTILIFQPTPTRHLTTIRVNGIEIGEMALGCLLDMIEDPLLSLDRFVLRLIW
ncbi:MAG: hypothetical protein U5R30_09590 [Deltaproteobacteria bacterium]|nr:hypothetical protein [Deltaproteobacteria bacterium]